MSNKQKFPKLSSKDPKSRAQEAQDIIEDYALSVLALSRDIKNQKTISHKKAWK